MKKHRRRHTDIEDIQKLEKAFLSVHHRQKEAEASETFQQDVMRHLRRLHVHENGADRAMADARAAVAGVARFLSTTRFVWRFAALTSLLGVFLAAYAIRTGFGPEYDFTNLLTEDSAGLLIARSLGVL